MTYYSQLDPRWKDQTYYNGFTFKSYGCLVTSLAMLCDKEPPEVAQILRDNGCFDSNGMLLSDKAAQVLGLEYNGKSTDRPDYPCIAETLYYDKVSTPAPEQHFFVTFPDGAIWDPLETNINYPIKSFRLFKPKEGVTMGFSDAHMKSVIKNVFSKFRKLFFFANNDAAEEQEAEFRLQQIKQGSVTAAADQIQDYFNSAEFKSKWVTKSVYNADIKKAKDDAFKAGKASVVCPACLPPTVCPDPIVCPEPKPCTEVCEDKSASELFRLAIRKFLKI